MPKELYRINHCRSMLDQPSGSTTLLTVIVLVVLILVIFGIVLRINHVYWKNLHKQVDRTQAQYNCEAGIQMIMDSLMISDCELSGFHTIALPWGDECIIETYPFGTMIECRATSLHIKSETIIKTYVTGKISSEINHAIVLNNRNTPMVLTGDIVIHGDIATGRLGSQTRSLRGVPFSGVHDGSTVIYTTENTLYQYNSSVVNQTIEWLDWVLVEMPYESEIHPDKPLHYVRSELLSLYIDPDPKPSIYVSQGRARIDSKTTIPAGSIIAARDTIYVDSYHGEDILCYSQQGIRVYGQSHFSGQLIAVKEIAVEEASQLVDASAIFLRGYIEDGDIHGQISLMDSSSVTGSIVHSIAHSDTLNNDVTIFVAEDVTINGQIICDGMVDFNGTLNGCLYTNRTYFYLPPQHYYNWLRTGVISAKSGTCPLGLSGATDIGYYNYEIRK